MTNHLTPKMTFDRMFKLALLALFAYMAYLFSGYVENGRYAVITSESSLVITDTRTGETVLYKLDSSHGFERFDSSMGGNRRESLKVFRHQKQLQIIRSKDSENEQDLPID